MKIDFKGFFNKWFKRKKSTPFVYMNYTDTQYGITLRPMCGQPADVRMVSEWLGDHQLGSEMDFPRITYFVTEQVYEEFEDKFPKFVFDFSRTKHILP